ncbi:uncharacterized protein LOC112595600 [Melanaphis sacchari]|uniref:uncharacterized protein LOC112595600 n=1 Tax=Melanaphis sacchari TaxID=742174 RepID=UPI000DC13D6B|nr:uncharacterized protein LOC112595600 [Melanaphis sacchari]
MCKPENSIRRVLAAETIFRSTAISKNVISSEIDFKTPVNITDIDILSPAMFSNTANGGFIVGGTDPENFQIIFQCSNVDEESASANVELGVLNYEDHKNTKLQCPNKIWTNRLIVLARFSVLTIVVYGTTKDPETESVQKKDPSTITMPPLIDGPIDMSGAVSIPDNVMENVETEVKREFDELCGVRQNND